MRISALVASCVCIFLFADPAGATDLKVMKMGLGSGTVASSAPGINCGTDCDQSYGPADSVTLTATPVANFSEWGGDCSSEPSNVCTLPMSADRSVRAVFNLTTVIPTITDFTPEGVGAMAGIGGIKQYLIDNPTVNNAARFVFALPPEYKQNWILMSRSESLQTGTSEFPRILLPSANAQFVFSLGLRIHSSYPGSHPDAIEYMQWDPDEKNFRFHEIVLADIGAMGSVPARSRGITIDDPKCTKCHSTQNVPNSSAAFGTTGTIIPPTSVKSKNKPNWDAYDSWGGMMPFNRDRIYQGSVEAAAFRKIFNFWTWRDNDFVRSIIEQLDLQPAGVSAAHSITRDSGGVNDSHINFGFDGPPPPSDPPRPVLTEPAPTGVTPPTDVTYTFNGAPGTPPGSPVTQGGSFVTLHHSNIAGSDEGRAVRFFDLLGGLSPAGSNFNAKRVADSLISHQFATGSVRINVRPIALAIATGCISNPDPLAAPGTSARTFFDARHGMNFANLLTDTSNRRHSLPRRKADIEKLNLTRVGDPYLYAPSPTDNNNGVILQYGSTTSKTTDASNIRLREEIFRRFQNDGTAGGGFPLDTVTGALTDREIYNNQTITLYRYFLEPLGISVDKWSMSVRGRSRTYTFADVFNRYTNEIKETVGNDYLGHTATNADCPRLITDSVAQFVTPGGVSKLPPPDATPTYTDVQRIFNKSCIECHGGLGYPPYRASGSLDLSERETDPPGGPQTGWDRFEEPYTNADDRTSVFAADGSGGGSIYRRITDDGSLVDPTDPEKLVPYDPAVVNEDCPARLMPCGGPPLSQADILTIRRWIAGGSPHTAGDPHIKTVDGINYDFQASGEFILLRGPGLEIQARQTAVETDAPLGPNAHTGLTSSVSVNTAVALRVGKHRITYLPNLSGQPDPSGLQLRIDGKLTQLRAGGIPLTSGGRIIPTSAPGGIQIKTPGGGTVVITPGWWNHYQLWFMNIDTRNVRATQGVMGVIAPGNWLPALPDGSFLGPRPKTLQQRHKILYGIFANKWRVNDTNSIFDYAPGTSTETFTIAGCPAAGPQSCTPPPSKPPLKVLALEVAEQHCQALVDNDVRGNCVQDVMVTAEPEFAQTYLRAQQISLNAIPSAPVLIFPEDFKIDLVKPVEFSWNNATDSDGDPITYQLCVWSESERPNDNKCDTVSTTASWVEGISNVLLVILLGLLLLVILLLLGMKKKPTLLLLVVIVILAAVILTYYFGGSRTVSNSTMVAQTTTELETGKSYYWKIIAEDSKGDTVESETWRFTMK